MACRWIAGNPNVVPEGVDSSCTAATGTYARAQMRVLTTDEAQVSLLRAVQMLSLLRYSAALLMQVVGSR